MLFLRNNNDQYNKKIIIENMLSRFQKLGCNMRLKAHFYSHICTIFPKISIALLIRGKISPGHIGNGEKTPEKMECQHDRRPVLVSE
jgi:hypothetical protein